MAQWIELRAGPLVLAFDPEWAFVRRIRLGDHEVLRGIYAPVRDKNWGTVRPRVSNLAIQAGEGNFRLSFDVECKEREIDLFWQGAIEGEADGTVRFTFKGVARSTFHRQRIGFCVLHPIAECVGRPCTIEKPDGSIERSSFPRYISPDQPFFDVRAITYEVLPGLSAEVRCEGDTFETEDQRNWTDASFKTYCTPLALPRPVEVHGGTVIEQSVTLRLRGTVPAGAAEPREVGPVALTLADRPFGSMPRLGLAMASHGGRLSLRERSRLKALNLSHLRVELRLAEPDWERAFSRATDEAAALGAALEVALLLPEAPEEPLRALKAELVRLSPRVASWLVLPTAQRSTTPPGLVGLARQYLATDDRGVRFAGGTNRYFTELNRERPHAEELDLVCYSLNPQVHTFDDVSMIESLEGQAWTVRSARELAGVLPLAVTPVTLKPRSARPAEPGELPPGVDPRQMTLFGAAWTLGSVSALAHVGLFSATYFETTGWLGVMETEQGSPLPDKFPSRPGAVFPVYHVFADLGEFAAGELIPVASSDRLRAAGLAIRKRGKTRLLLASLTDQPQQVLIRGLRGFLSLRRLDQANLRQATAAPEAFCAKSGEIVDARGEALELNLLPYGIVRIDGGR